MASNALSMEVEIPQGIEVTVTGDTVSVKGPKGTVSRTFMGTGLKFASKDGKITIKSAASKKNTRAVAGTVSSHIKSLITGVTDGYPSKLKLVYSHFPMRIKTQGKELVIENFLGEHNPRKAKIIGDSKVEVKGQILTVTGNGRESVGQTAANIEQATRILDRDHRVFQDGIYLIERNGVPVK